MNKCRKCARFPFCEENPEECNKFIKRNYETKLVKVNGLNYTFERIDKNAR